MAVRHYKHILVAMKSESSRGVDAFGGSAPASGDWIAAYEADVKEVMTEVLDESIRPWHSGLAHDVQGSHTEVSLLIPLRGKKGAAGTTPPDSIDAGLKAAGHKATVDSGVSVAYNPETFHTQANCPTATVYIAYFASDGSVRVQRILGVRFGEARVTAAPKRPLMLSLASGMGLYGELAAATSAAPTNPTAYSGGKTNILSQGMTLDLGSETMTLQSFELINAWSIEMDDSLTGSSEAKDFDLLRAARVGGSVLFRDSAHLEYLLGKRRDAGAIALEAAWSDGTDTITLNAPAVQIGEIGMNKGNVYQFPCPYYCLTSAEAGNDDYTLTFT